MASPGKAAHCDLLRPCASEAVYHQGHPMAVGKPSSEPTSGYRKRSALAREYSMKAQERQKLRQDLVKRLHAHAEQKAAEAECIVTAARKAKERQD